MHTFKRYTKASSKDGSPSISEMNPLTQARRIDDDDDIESGNAKSKAAVMYTFKRYTLTASLKQTYPFFVKL